MSDTSLIEGWRLQLASQSHGLHLADPMHPLEIYVGSTDAGAARFVIRSKSKATKPALSDIVLVERHVDSSHRWNLVFTLQDRKFLEVFLRLVDDCHARSAAAPNEAVALDLIGSVIDEWRRLMKPRRMGRLSMDELRGLVGEMWLMVNRFSSNRSTEATVLGWLGPLGLPQDFWYPEDGFHEAKSAGPSATRIRVTSEQQLDPPDLELLVLRVANVDDQAEGAVNLIKLVNKVRAGLTGESVNHAILDDRLASLGVDLSDPFYRDTWFLVSSVTSYAVTDGFPALRASDLPDGISRVKYQLTLSNLADFIEEVTEVAH